MFSHEVKHDKFLSFRNHSNNVIENFFRHKRRFPKFRSIESARKYIGHWVSEYNAEKLNFWRSFILFREDDLSKSKVFEWLIVNELKAEFFWRDPYKNEVDIIMANKKPTPIEIKYGKIDLKGLLVFMKKFGINEGYVISPGKEGSQKTDGKTISIVPAFKFLLKQERL